MGSRNSKVVPLLALISEFYQNPFLKLEIGAIFMGTTYLVPMICSFPMIFNIRNSLSEFRILNFMEVIFDIWGFFFQQTNEILLFF